MVDESEHGPSLAFECRGGGLKVKLEDASLRVKYRGVTYFVSEAPSVTTGGKKHFVQEIV
ncbi:TPA: hypothetical protein HA225_04190 [Candidatus Micrarchaeota archaeon]|nr:hypothetical protein [Candidatus Micrarchaeota archaeon]HIH30103.1 hypothetical protein [Candidatus Micrarchaeota archaeon]